MKYLIGIFFLLSLNVQLTGQSFGYDATFNPYFDITVHQFSGGGLVRNVLENEQNGKLLLGGSFQIGRLQGVTKINSNGSRDTSFKEANLSDVNLVQSINDTAFALSFANGGAIVMDSTGKQIWPVWETNKRGTVSCAETERPFFFSDGSSLMSNGPLGVGGGCRIFQPNDTFPQRYIIKVDSLGLWDSSFTKDANEAPRGFKAYDSSRIWVYGQPAILSQYDSIQVDGLFRIYHDGTLDTTFKSPLSPHINTRTFEIGETEEDGKFILYGIFLLKGDTVNHSCMARFHADGSLDTTFNNYGQNYSIYFNGAGGVDGYAKTEDRGYLIGGGFDTLQGVAKNAIAKLDSNGNLESQYFTGEGPDSVWSTFGYPAWVSGIYKSAFGGYYVTGDFQKWDGQPVQPIVRLKGLLVGDEEIKVESRKLKVETYPNPTSQNLHIRIGQVNAIQEIRLYDLFGKEHFIDIKQLNSLIYSLNLNRLAKGVYFLKLQFVDGSAMDRKVIKN